MGILDYESNTMKNMLICIVALCFFCAEMPDTFKRVDENKLRVIGVVIGPKPEVAPGDTVTATVYFGGNKVVSLSNFQLAHKYTWTIDGAIFKDYYTITPLSTPLGFPDSARFSFVIKPDVYIGRQGYDTVSQTTVDSICKLMMQNKDTVSTLLNTLSDNERLFLGTTIERMALPVGLLFTAHSENGSSLFVGSRFTIKYQVPLPKVFPANNNPTISWVGICKVPSQYAKDFSPYNPDLINKFTLTYLYNTKDPLQCDSIIDVDTGYAYYLIADDGVIRNGQGVDTVRDTVTDYNGNLQRETYSYKWFYQNVDMVTNFEDSLMNIDNSTSSCIEMKPAYNTAMLHFKVWVAAYDEMNSIQQRPRGVCVRCVKGMFHFSDAYKKVMSLK